LRHDGAVLFAELAATSDAVREDALAQAQDGTCSVGVDVAGGWYWYSNWVEIVRKHRRANARGTSERRTRSCYEGR
jgi:hypothetical protein